MADIYSQSKRSEIMAKISGNDTRPEKIVRQFLFANGYRYRKNVKQLPGRPDIVLPKYRKVIFVHGCFWHGHSCKAGKLPNSRRQFWTKKINDTQTRDARNKIDLIDLGWNTIEVWECELRNKEIKNTTLEKLLDKLRKLN